ncbi:MAG: hypothetical protein ACLFOZ_15130 [Cyclobacteriaceae bacterium]
MTTATDDKTFDLKGERLPFQFQLFGWVLLFMSLLTAVFAPYFSPFLFILSILILTARRGIEINTAEKTIRIYNHFLFIKKGKPEPYESISSLYIHAGQVIQKVYTMITTSTTSRKIEYDAYIKTGDGSRIYLMSHHNRDALVQKLAPLASFLQLDIMQSA